MNAFEKYKQLLKTVEQLKAEEQRNEGKMDQLRQEMRDKYGCETLKQLKAKLSKLKKRRDSLEEAFEEQLQQVEEFLNKHSDVIGDLD